MEKVKNDGQVINNTDDKIVKITDSINKLKNKESKFLFCVPETENPSALIYEIYFHANVVKQMGYQVILLTEKNNYEHPNWIESELTDLVLESMGDSNIKVGPEDIMIIPELFTNVMEQTKKLPCLRIGLLQSIDYMLNSLVPGTDWSSFGIRNIITTSKTLEDLIDKYYRGKFNIKRYNVGIPDYFEKSEKPQKPIISIMGRNPNEISKIVKLFFSKYPQYSWVTFDPMLTKSKPPQTMRRVDFAKRLRENFAGVWIDRIASFGTFPLECMKSGTIPICLKPDIMPEYVVNRDENNKITDINKNIGLWTENFYDIPDMIAEAIIKFLDDAIPSDVYEKMEETAKKYNQYDSEKELNDIYQEFVNQRIDFFDKAINNNNIKK